MSRIDRVASGAILALFGFVLVLHSSRLVYIRPVWGGIELVIGSYFVFRYSAYAVRFIDCVCADTRRLLKQLFQ